VFRTWSLLPTRQRAFYTAAIVAVVTSLVLSILAVIPNSPIDNLLRPTIGAQNKDIGLGITVSGSAVPEGVRAQLAPDNLQASLPTPDPKYILASPMVDIGPSGPLKAPMTVTMPLPRKLEDGEQPLLIVNQSHNDDDWHSLPVQLSADGTHVTFTVDHLSWFGLDILLKGAVDFVAEAFDAVTADFYKSAKQPSCSQESQARTQGYKITPDYKRVSTVFWCMGYRADTKDRILKLVNNQNYPLEIDSTKLAVIDPGPVPFSFEEFRRLNHTVIMPKEEMQFQINPLDPGQTATLETHVSGPTIALGAVDLVAKTFVEVFAKFFPNSKTVQTLEAAKPSAECSTLLFQSNDEEHLNLPELIKACFNEQMLKASFGAVAGVLLSPIVLMFSAAKFARLSLSGWDEQKRGLDKYKLTVSRSNAPTGIPADIVGGWSRHVTAMDINADGTGTMVEDIYTLCDELQNTHCDLNAELEVTPVDDRHARIKYTKVWFVQGNQTITPAQALPDEVERVGDTMLVSVNKVGLLYMQYEGRLSFKNDMDHDGAVDDGNLYCGPKTPQSETYHCGA